MNHKAKILVTTGICPVDEQAEVVVAALIFHQPYEFHTVEICSASEGGYRTMDDYQPNEIKEFIERWRFKAGELDVSFMVDEDVAELAEAQ